jgi:hypothetical protein
VIIRTGGLFDHGENSRVVLMIIKTPDSAR